MILIQVSKIVKGQIVGRAHSDCKDKLVTVEGRPPPKLLFFTSVKDVTCFNDENKLSGRAFKPVDSRCKVFKDVILLNDEGNDPPGRHC